MTNTILQTLQKIASQGYTPTLHKTARRTSTRISNQAHAGAQWDRYMTQNPNPSVEELTNFYNNLSARGRRELYTPFNDYVRSHTAQPFMPPAVRSGGGGMLPSAARSGGVGGGMIPPAVRNSGGGMVPPMPPPRGFNPPIPAGGSNLPVPRGGGSGLPVRAPIGGNPRDWSWANTGARTATRPMLEGPVIDAQIVESAPGQLMRMPKSGVPAKLRTAGKLGRFGSKVGRFLGGLLPLAGGTAGSLVGGHYGEKIDRSLGGSGEIGKTVGDIGGFIGGQELTRLAMNPAALKAVAAATPASAPLATAIAAPLVAYGGVHLGNYLGKKTGLIKTDDQLAQDTAHAVNSDPRFARKRR